MTYILRHWRGELGLILAFVVNTLLAYVVVLALLYVVVAAGLPAVAVWLVVALVLVWFVWAVVGAVRTSLKAIGAWRSNLPQALAAGVVLLFLIAAVSFTVQDVVALL